MSSIRPILALMPPKAPISVQGQLLKNAVYLGGQLGAHVHIFAAVDQLESLRRQILEGEIETRMDAHHIVFHAISKHISNQIRDAVEKYDCEFAVTEKISQLGPGGEASLERQILKAIPRPVLLIPPGLDLERHPIRSFLVPLSGEERASESLRFALKIASELKTPVDLVHVTDPDRPCMHLQALERIGDEFQHEYPEIMDRVVSEASPFSDSRERSLVRNIHHASGRTSEEIRKVMRSEPGGVVVIEWKGNLLRGHAKVVKDLVRERENPIFFVKMGRKQKSTLKVGPHFGAA